MMSMRNKISREAS